MLSLIYAMLELSSAMSKLSISEISYYKSLIPIMNTCQDRENLEELESKPKAGVLSSKFKEMLGRYKN